MTIVPVVDSSSQQGRDLAAYISGKFSDYCSSTPWEEIYVSTDRDEYVAGEDLWFSTYLVDRQSINLSTHSKVIYFELTDAEDKPLFREKVLLDGGFGQGHMRLPDTLASGTYSIRAYTNWMRNFLPVNCFMKDINIYNSFSSGYFTRKIHNQEPDSISTRNGAAGFSVNFHRNENGGAEIRLETTGESLYRENDVFCLFIQSHGTKSFAENALLKQGKTMFSIRTEDFKPGINQVTMFDYRCQPVYEKFLYYYPPVKELFSFDAPETASARQKVILSLDFKGLPADVQASRLSLSVTPVTGSPRFTDMSDYLIIGTEFGTQATALLHGRSMNSLSPDETEKMLAKLNSRWIRWDLIFNREQQHLDFLPEKEEHFIYGTLMETDTYPALQGEIVLMSLPGNIAQFQYAVTDTSGNFSFTVPPDSRERDLIIQPDNPERFKGIVIRSQFADPDKKSTAVRDSLNYKVPTYITKWGLNYRISSIYGSESSVEIPREASAVSYLKRFYGKPDFELMLDNYQKLPLMEEVFFELVPRVRLKRWDSVSDISILDPTGNRMYNELPGLMVDGVVVKNPSVIADLDPGIVRKIDVVWNQYMVDAYIFNGIVNVLTRSADFSSVKVPPGSLRMRYLLAGEKAEFRSPVYSADENKESRIPDFRNTLYWNPEIRPGIDGKATYEFWTSDYNTDYIINIQGVCGDGKIVSFNRLIKTRNINGK